MGLQKDQKFSIPEAVLFQEVSGETVLLDLDSESYFGLDEIGTRIWMLLNEGRGQGGIVDALLEEYEVERDTLEADVAELLGNLLEAGLIKA
jgi:hypothetical protein